MNSSDLLVALQAALAVARQRQVAAGFTVVDTSGQSVLQFRMDGANYMANEVSWRKAKTAFLFRMPTHVLNDLVEKMPRLAQAVQQVPGDAFLLEGGLPLLREGRCVGGVGVAGGQFADDLAIAEAFVAALPVAAAA